jgi:hypothetical protein
MSLATARPGRKANIPEDLENLINLRITREQRLFHGHFRENTSNTPHVDSGRVMSGTKQDFGCTIPEGDDLEERASASVP